MDDENRENAFLEGLCREPVEGTQDEEKDDDNNEIVEPIKIKLTRMHEYLEDVQHFLESRGHATEAFKIGSIIDDVSCVQIKATKQTSFNPWLVSSQ